MNMKTKRLMKIALPAFVVLFLLSSGLLTPLFADKLVVPIGKALTIKVPGDKIKKIMAVKDNVVVVMSASEQNEVILAGVGNPDFTQLIIWDVKGNRQTLDIETYSEAQVIQDKFKLLFAESSVSLQIFPDEVILQGSVDTQEKVKKAEDVAKSLVSNLPVRNLVELKRDMSTELLIKEAIKIPGINVTAINLNNPSVPATGTAGVRVVLEGSVKDQNEYMRMMEVVKGYIPDVNNISNLVRISHPLQVVFQAFILQVSKNKSKDLGITWGGTTAQGGDLTQGVMRFYENVSNEFRGDGARTLGAPLDSWANPFKANSVNRFDIIAGRVQAWESKNLVKVLSNPKLMVYANATLGNANKMQSSGWKDELTGGKGAAEEGTAYVQVKQRIPYFGKADNRGIRDTEYVDADLTLAIRDLFIDENKLKFSVYAEQDDAISRGPELPPEVNKRFVNTTVRVGDEDTVVLGGLINNSKTRTNGGIPILSKLPYVGKLFRTTNYSDDARELVILLTPKIVQEEKTMAGNKRFETVPVPRRSERLEELHNLFQDIKKSHFPVDKK
jgi:Flp pilus assembly secretin CpaC